MQRRRTAAQLDAMAEGEARTRMQAPRGRKGFC